MKQKEIESCSVFSSKQSQRLNGEIITFILEALYFKGKIYYVEIQNYIVITLKNTIHAELYVE